MTRRVVITASPVVRICDYMRPRRRAILIHSAPLRAFWYEAHACVSLQEMSRVIVNGPCPGTLEPF